MKSDTESDEEQLGQDNGLPGSKDTETQSNELWRDDWLTAPAKLKQMSKFFPLLSDGNILFQQTLVNLSEKVRDCRHSRGTLTSNFSSFRFTQVLDFLKLDD